MSLRRTKALPLTADNLQVMSELHSASALSTGIPAGPGEIYNRLLNDRIVFLGTEVDDEIANILCAQMLFLEGQDREKDIWLYINSPGGSVTAGMAIYDTMQFIRPDVSTLCVGQAASMGAFLLAAGKAGKRYALPNSRMMLHQPSGGSRGVAADIEIQAQELSLIHI